MNDMAAIIVAKSDQINAGDLVGITRTVRVAGVSVNAGTEQPVSIKIDGDTKVYRPCKSMSRVLVAAWGADSSKFVGRSMTLYNDPDVLWAGMKVGGIRISHMSHIDSPITLALAENKKNRKLFTVKPLPTQRTTSPAASLPEAAVDTPQPSAEQPSGAAPTEGASKAAEWVESFIAKVNDAPDREALMAVQLKAEKALAKLDENEPTLYALAVAAIKTRLAELDAADAGDEFAVEVLA
jgi:hypothetical protein